jgi:hypothetical protein
MKIGYARVSTKDQTVALQVNALKKAGCTKVHTLMQCRGSPTRPKRMLYPMPGGSGRSMEPGTTSRLATSAGA